MSSASHLRNERHGEWSYDGVQSLQEEERESENVERLILYTRCVEGSFSVAINNKIN